MNSKYFKHVFAHPVGRNHFVEVYRTDDNVSIRKLGLDLDVRRHKDHGGFSLCLGLLGKAFVVEFYDTRHWDNVTGRYKEKHENV